MQAPWCSAFFTGPLKGIDTLDGHKKGLLFCASVLIFCLLGKKKKFNEEIRHQDNVYE